MKIKFIVMVLALVSLFMTSCGKEQEVVEALNQQQKQEIEKKWAKETAKIREDGHEVFKDADLIGTVIEKKEDEITISSIAREKNTGYIMLGTDSSDENIVKLPRNIIVQKFNVDNKEQAFELSKGSLNDVTIGSILSLLGNSEGQEFMADKLIVWSLQE